MGNHYRPVIQNGPIAKRARRAAKPSLAPHAATPRRAHRQSPDIRPLAAASFAVRELCPPRALVALVGCGALIAAGFIFGLREHFVAYAFNREEVKVQSKIEQVISESRALNAEQQQAGSPLSLARSIGGRGRVQELRLDPAPPRARAKPSPQP